MVIMLGGFSGVEKLCILSGPDLVTFYISVQLNGGQFVSNLVQVTLLVCSIQLYNERKKLVKL